MTAPLRPSEARAAAPDPAGLIDWILRQAMGEDGLAPLVEGFCRRALALGLPVLRAGIGMPSIDPTLRGLTVVWWRDEGVVVHSTAYGADGEAVFLRSPTHFMLANGLEAHRWRLDVGEGCAEMPLLAAIRARGGTDYRMRLVPFGPDTVLRGAAFAIATDQAGGFTPAQMALIESFIPALGLAAYRIGLAQVANDTLGVYLGSQTSRRVLAGEFRRGEGRFIPAAILLADLRGFTALSEREDAMRVVGWLNEHFDCIGEPVTRHGGEILKFLGDGLLAVFPVEDPDAAPCPVCAAALNAAGEAIRRNEALNAERRALGAPELPLDLVLHFGEVVYGNVGAARRLDFTVIGPAVNEASRMERFCAELGRPLLLSSSFATRCAVEAQSLGFHTLRGVAGEREILGLPEHGG